MKYLFLNPQSCSGLALKKWSRISNQLPELAEAIIVDDFYQINWGQFHIGPEDSFISAGGDGTLHCMVNALIKNKGIDVLSQVKIGHIGLGSNNSFLRPYSDCTIVGEIPMKISDLVYIQDLMEIEVTKDKKSEKFYCVANSSIGFLATANIIFNTAKDVAVLKKWNSDLADVYTFIKALIKWKSIQIGYGTETLKQVFITNMHFMKKPFYATDLGFPEVIPADNGLFRLNVLWKRSRPMILKKFFSMMVFKDLLQGRDLTAEVEQVEIESSNAIPIEMDGEIYYGTNFKVKIYKKGIRLCK